MPVYSAVNPASDNLVSATFSTGVTAYNLLNDFAFDGTTDSTWIQFASGQSGSVNCGNVTPTSGELLLGWQIQVRGLNASTVAVGASTFSVADTVNVTLAAAAANYTTRTVKDTVYSGTLSGGSVITAPIISMAQASGTPKLTKIAASLVTAARPVVTITSPAASSTVRNSIPSVSWTYTQSDGYTQSAYQLQVLSGSTVVYDTGQVNSSATSASIPAGTLTAGTSYTIQVRAWCSIPVNWTTYTHVSTYGSVASVTYQPPAPNTPTLTVAAAADNSAVLTIKGSMNLLIDQDSDFPVGTATSTTAVGNWTCTAGTNAIDTVTFLTGASSWKYTSTTTGTVTFSHPQFFPATPNQPFGFVLATKHTTAARLVTMTIAWYQSDKVTSAGTSTTATLTPGSTAAFFSQVATATPPAGTAYAKVSWTVASTTADIYYFDSIGVGPGINTAITIATLANWIPGNASTDYSNGFMPGCTYEVQRSTDGGSTWTSLTSAGFLTPSPTSLPADTSSNAITTWVDQSVLPNVAYQYRVRSNQPILNGTITSAYTSGVAYTPTNETQWRLRPVNSTYANTAAVTAVDITAWHDGDVTEMVQEFNPIGSTYSTVLSNQTFRRQGTFTLHAFGSTAQTNAVAIVYATAPVWVLSPYGEAQCVRLTTRNRNVMGPAAAPHHFWDCSWIEVG